ncbi:hypothetical protein C8F01DRAFT_1188972 [Mycena amicta]|nr:hypothetical protein C8F01DRAFT_1188972 [Mycena amicta]
MPPQVSKAERALLLFSLRTPMHEDACCAAVMFHILERCFTSSTGSDHARQAPILRAAMTLLATDYGGDYPKYEEEDRFPPLQRKLVSCVCKPAIQTLPYHPRPMPFPFGTMAAYTAWNELLGRLCTELIASLNRLSPGKFRAAKLNVAPEDQPWPSSIRDIIPIPSGEEQASMGLHQWAQNMPYGCTIYPLMSAVARFWHPFSLSLHRLQQQSLLHVDEALKILTDTGDSRAFVLATTCVVRFLEELFIIDRGTMTMFYRSNLDQMKRSADIIHTTATNLVAEFPARDLVLRWCDDMKRQYSTRGPDGKFAESDFQQSDGAQFAMVFSLIMEVRNRDQCLHIHCENVLDTRSQVCSKCGVVRFCSPQCLKAAWKDSKLPHKELCQMVIELRTATGTNLKDAATWSSVLHDPGDENARFARRILFARECIRAGVDVNIPTKLFKVLALTQWTRHKFLEGRIQERLDLQFGEGG